MRLCICYIFSICVLLNEFIFQGNCGFIDFDTPTTALKAISLEDFLEYELIFSDEFETDNRNFYDGNDPKWTVMHKDDYTNAALQFYHQDNVKTSNGFLNITTEYKDITFLAYDDEKLKWYPLTKNYRSGMIQGWNKFCFVGGIVEISAELPGDANIGGLWPAMWLMGNLARATFTGTSDRVWPWSFDTCDRNVQHQQKFSACNNYNHFGFKKNKGRGAPEIDILEVLPGTGGLPLSTTKKPYLSTSFQMSPGLNNKYRPVVAHWPRAGYWYGPEGFMYGVNSSLNIYFYGEKLTQEVMDQSYLADALSANTNLVKEHFQGQHIYRLEWIPGRGGHLRWYLDGELIYGINQDALINGGIFSEEPSYLIFNTAISSMWGFPVPCPPGCACDCWDCKKVECLCAIPNKMCNNLPAHFLIDFVRIYQNKNDSRQWVGCTSKDFPMMRYLEYNKQYYTEKGKRLPLLPIEKGGANCDSDAECGFGNCSSKHRCICDEFHVGANCLAQDAYFDNPYDEWASDFSVYMPGIFDGKFKMLLAAAGAVFIATFILGVVSKIRLRWDIRTLEPVSIAGSARHPSRAVTPITKAQMTPHSYQNSTVYKTHSEHKTTIQ